MRTSRDVGGQGTIPTPGVPTVRGRTLGERLRDVTPVRERNQERPGEQEGRRETKHPREPERRRETDERRVAPSNRPAKPAPTTGEPELRRRRQ
jgi:hypothetical protein